MASQRFQRLFRARRLVAPGDASQLDELFPSKIKLHREFFDIASGMQLETFWKDLNGDQGPGAVLYVHGQEVLVFDCVGFPKGHFHAMIGHSRVPRKKRQKRIHLPEKTIHEQVIRCAFELRWNLRYYLNHHKKAEIQHFNVEDNAVRTAADLVEKKLLEYCTSMPSRFANEAGRDRMSPSSAWTERIVD